MKYKSYIVAYVIIRGSVPVYWTQPGYKYRPTPVIDNGTYFHIMLIVTAKWFA